MQPKLEAQDIRLEYFQPRTNTRLLALGGVNVSSPSQKSEPQAREHSGIFGNERGQLRMRGFELFNGLF